MLNKKNAFTLAEVLIVLTILGIIAAISMTTLRPAEFKARGLAVAAKKVLYDIDVATTELLLDYATAGTEAAIPNCAAATLKTEYKKKLSAIRKTGACADATSDNSFYLKSGACVGFAAAATSSTTFVFPGETYSASDASLKTTTNCAVIYFDSNGADAPNAYGSDRFIIPLDNSGIKYAS